MNVVLSNYLAPFPLGERRGIAKFNGTPISYCFHGAGCTINGENFEISYNYVDPCSGSRIPIIDPGTVAILLKHRGLSASNADIMQHFEQMVEHGVLKFTQLTLELDYVFQCQPVNWLGSK